MEGSTGAASDAESPQARLFGAGALRHGDREAAFLPERRFQLLALLALRAGQWVPRDEAAALLWPERSLSEARRNLRHVVFKAREFVGEQAPQAGEHAAQAPDRALQAQEHALRWVVSTDVHAFQLAVAAQRGADALALYRAPLLAGLEADAGDAFTQWLQAERARLESIWHEVAVSQLAALTARPDEQRALAGRMLARDGCDELAVTALIEADLAARRPALAERRYREFAAQLAEQLGVEPSHRLRDLLRTGSLAPRSPTSTVDGAPASPSATASFIGRRAELAELARALADPACRALVIAGAGGVGKSSLARQAVAACAIACTWIELQDLDALDAAVARLAAALDVELRDLADPVASLAQCIGAAPRLLVFDNAEHIAGLAAFVDRLLAAAPAATALLTSRQRLNLRDESVLLLQGLAVPDEDSRDAEAAVAFDAVALFDARARVAQRSFAVARHINAVVQIVEAVGGSPLAIGLAASWVRVLPVEAIAHDLRGTLDVLEHDPASPGAPSRPEHASMRAVLERSWALLAPRERDALEALSVFASGFTHASAREVAGVALPLLSSLLDKCMVSVDDAGRFGLHPLIAAEAAARAAADAAALAARRERFIGHFARQLHDLVQAHAGDHRPIVQALRAEMANGQRAWQQAVEGGRADALRQMAPAWRRYFVASGRFVDGQRHFELALALRGDEGRAHALALVRAALAWLAKASEDAERAMAIAGAVLAEVHALADPPLELDCTNTMGAAELLRGHWSDARRWFERSLQTARMHNLRRETATALNNLGLTALCEGQALDDSADHFSRAAAIQREMGDHVSLARTLHNIGSVHMASGDWPAARDANDRALRYAQAHEADAISVAIEFMQGATLIELAQLDAAQRHLQACLQRSQALNDDTFSFKSGYYLARIAVRRGRGRDASAALLGAARRAHEQGRHYDLLYIALFIAEALRLQGHEPEAQALVRAAGAAPMADAFVRAVIDAGAWATSASQPNGGGVQRAPLTLGELIDVLTHSTDVDRLTLALQPATP